MQQRKSTRKGVSRPASDSDFVSDQSGRSVLAWLSKWLGAGQVTRSTEHDVELRGVKGQDRQCSIQTESRSR